MQNQLKIAFVYSIVIIVGWLSIFTCYAQGIDEQRQLEITTDQSDKYSSPTINNQDNNKMIGDINIEEKRTDERQYDAALIDDMGRKQNENANRSKSSYMEIPDSYQQDSDGSYLRTDDEQIDDNYTPIQEKQIINHNSQEKNKLPASEPNLNKDQIEKDEEKENQNTEK
ncbi:hypothetical protein JYU20_04895 [Bacteroidales bacterium AH-315-I05]|nr:hypothetical protein [Bacteroidales bacterium AH-315-I05]